jgi:hypothetical protein
VDVFDRISDEFPFKVMKHMAKARIDCSPSGSSAFWCLRHLFWKGLGPSSIDNLFGGDADQTYRNAVG